VIVVTAFKLQLNIKNRHPIAISSLPVVYVNTQFLSIFVAISVQIHELFMDLDVKHII